MSFTHPVRWWTPIEPRNNPDDVCQRDAIAGPDEHHRTGISHSYLCAESINISGQLNRCKQLRRTKHRWDCFVMRSVRIRIVFIDWVIPDDSKINADVPIRSNLSAHHKTGGLSPPVFILFSFGSVVLRYRSWTFPVIQQSEGCTGTPSGMVLSIVKEHDTTGTPVRFAPVI